MNRRSVTAGLLFLVWVGCAPLQPPPDGAAAGRTAAPVRDYRSLVAHLRESGLRVEAAGEVEQPFFTPKAKILRIGDSGEAQVYEYATEEQAAAEAARVNSNGSIGTSMPMWIAPPHHRPITRMTSPSSSTRRPRSITSSGSKI